MPGLYSIAVVHRQHYSASDAPQAGFPRRYSVGRATQSRLRAMPLPPPATCLICPSGQEPSSTSTMLPAASVWLYRAGAAFTLGAARAQMSTQPSANASKSATLMPQKVMVCVAEIVSTTSSPEFSMASMTAFVLAKSKALRSSVSFASKP